MARYTGSTEFAFSGSRELRAVVPDAGTTLTFEIYSGEGWVPDTNSPISSPEVIFTRGIRFRLTPDVGGFFIDEGLYL